jgi:hypothetical protein
VPYIIWEFSLAWIVRKGRNVRERERYRDSFYLLCGFIAFDSGYIDRYFGIYFEMIMDTIIFIVILIAVCFFLGFLSYKIWRSKMDGVYKGISLTFLSLFCFPVAVYNAIMLGLYLERRK